MYEQQISDIIRDRIKRNNHRFFASDNISEYLYSGELEQLTGELTSKVKDMLRTLIIDIENDPNSIDTAKRIAKMLVNEVFHGRYSSRPEATEFPNIKAQDELYTVGPIRVNSACSHHLVPIQGFVWIGVLPSESVLGLSKFNRLTEWIMRRPHIQEEATAMLADELERIMRPNGLAVVMKAKHLCTTWRGVKDYSSWMTTSIMRGTMRENSLARAEFFKLTEKEHLKD